MDDIKQIGGEQMRILAQMIQNKIPGLGFALIVFPFFESGISNYISNAVREDMIKALDETVARLKYKKDFMTPEIN